MLTSIDSFILNHVHRDPTNPAQRVREAFELRWLFEPASLTEDAERRQVWAALLERDVLDPPEYRGQLYPPETAILMKEAREAVATRDPEQVYADAMTKRADALAVRLARRPPVGYGKYDGWSVDVRGEHTILSLSRIIGVITGDPTLRAAAQRILDDDDERVTWQRVTQRLARDLFVPIMTTVDPRIAIDVYYVAPDDNAPNHPQAQPDRDDLFWSQAPRIMTISWLPDQNTDDRK